MKPTPKSEIERRINRLICSLEKDGVDLALIVQNADRFYYSGTLQDGMLLVSRDGPVLFVRRTLARARAESPLPEVVGYRSVREIAEYVKDNGIPFSVVGLELDVLPASLYQAIESLFPKSRIFDISPAIRMMRAIKSHWELANIREAGRRLDRVFGIVRDHVRPGMTEYELYMLFSAHLLEEGSCPLVRARRIGMEVLPCYVLSGSNAAKHSLLDSPSSGGDGVTVAYPAGAGTGRITKGEPILIDAAFFWEGYYVDCTRVFAAGDLDRKFRKAHLVSRRCHKQFCKAVRDGKQVSEIYREIREIADREGLGGVFMDGVNFIGHGVGLELDELPVIFEGYRGAVEDGMVIALEPKFVFDSGTVGYESTYAVRDGVCESMDSFDTEIQTV
jgi:Xaa-Pro dipeptidase